MTEEEAKKKKCHNPSPWVEEWGGWCIASDCMMWRWKYETRNYEELPNYIKQSIRHEDELLDGHCGLAK